MTGPIADDDYEISNRMALERLRRVAAALSDTELTLALSDDWTIAAALVHLAFWDRRQQSLLQRWRKEGLSQAQVDVDTINDAVTALSKAVPPRAAVELVISAAEAIDAAVQQLPAELVGAIRAAGRRAILNRAVHRNAHLDDIERALAASRAGAQ